MRSIFGRYHYSLGIIDARILEISFKLYFALIPGVWELENMSGTRGRVRWHLDFGGVLIVSTNGHGGGFVAVCIWLTYPTF